MRTPTLLALALTAVLATLAAASPATAEPTCQDLAGQGPLCVEALGGPEAGGAGVDVAVGTVHTCVAFGVDCPGDNDG
jgi:hypothetical protein